MEINLWTMIVILVLIGAVASTIQTFITRGSGKEKVRGEETATETRRLTDEVRALRERVAVLERIVTGGNHALEHEIEKLRDR